MGMTPWQTAMEQSLGLPAGQLGGLYRFGPNQGLLGPAVQGNQKSMGLLGGSTSQTTDGGMSGIDPSVIQGLLGRIGTPAAPAPTPAPTPPPAAAAPAAGAPLTDAQLYQMMKMMPNGGPLPLFDEDNQVFARNILSGQLLGLGAPSDGGY